MAKTTLETSPYTILGLEHPTSRSNRAPTKDEIKRAYHRTLLLHHPDKISLRGTDVDIGHSPHHRRDTKYSLDEITYAYQLLSDPVLREDYDRLSSQFSSATEAFQLRNRTRGTHLGVETFDLSDLSYDEVNGSWSKSCRCGNQKGYVVTESDLEEELQSGEVYVGCEGCSLFIKVSFAAVSEQ